jgi:antitoxin ParD1/3/4
MAKRQTMNISIPPSLRGWVADRVSEGGYGSTSEYVRELLREDRERHAMKRLERKLLDGIESGPAVPMAAEDWRALHDEVDRRVARRTKGRR